MISLDAIRAAIAGPDPFTQMDRLVREEMATGRKVKEIVAAFEPLVDPVLDTPGLSEDGEEAFLGTLDALMGNCLRQHCYFDPPKLPTKAEIQGLPQGARVAFAARCARRVLPILANSTNTSERHYADLLNTAIELAEQTASGIQIASQPLMEIVDSLNGFIGGYETASVVSTAKVAAVCAVGNSRDAGLAATFALGASPNTDLVPAPGPPHYEPVPR